MVGCGQEGSGSCGGLKFVYSGLPQVREKSGKKYFFKVREMSGNFYLGQGKSIESGENAVGQGKLKL